jgi:hypothetical protein
MCEASFVTVFLVQVSGDKSTHKETGANWWWQEPIEKGVYINYGWKSRPRGVPEVWKKMQVGDKILIYCTTNVKPFSQTLSHIFTVRKVERKDQKATAHLGDKVQLKPGMPLDVIEQKAESRELSEEMRKCGGQGFNICEVDQSDLEMVMKWSESSKERKEGIEVSREGDLRTYLMQHPERIEKGLRLVTDFQEILPEGAGIPDVVCKDENDNYVAIELKADEADYTALGQVVSYKGAIIKKTNQKVRGIIVALGFDEKIRFGAEVTDSQGLRMAELKKYLLNFDLENA